MRGAVTAAGACLRVTALAVTGAGGFGLGAFAVTIRFGMATGFFRFGGDL